MSLDAQRGFTLIEVLVSAAIAMAVMGAVFTLLAPVRGTYLAQLELTDMHQRLRVGIDALAHDLRMGRRRAVPGQRWRYSVGFGGSHRALPRRQPRERP